MPKFICKKDIKFPGRGNKKGDNGKVLIIGGSEDYVGAVALAGLAALRTGCDWVTCACPKKVAWAINTLSPDLVSIKLKGNYISISHSKKLHELAKKHDAFLIGPGIGKRSGKIINSLIKNLNHIPKVIDADAIKMIRLQDTDNSIITPHRKEYSILLKNSKINDTTELLKNNIIIKKAPVDEIISKYGLLYNKTGNPGMTKAGTGDVLAGLAAGFLAQGMDMIQSAKNAAFINGYIGDLLLKQKKGYFYIASDLINDLEKIQKKLQPK